MVLAQALTQTVHEAGHGVDGQGRFGQIRGSGGQVDGRQFVQPHGVVGDHEVGRCLGQALASLGQHFGGGIEIGIVRIGGGNVGHRGSIGGFCWSERLPYLSQLRRSGALPPPDHHRFAGTVRSGHCEKATVSCGADP